MMDIILGGLLGWWLSAKGNAAVQKVKSLLKVGKVTISVEQLKKAGWTEEQIAELLTKAS